MTAPEGWFYLQSTRRKVIAFACPTCGLLTRFFSGARPVKHCGRVERPPFLTLLLPVRVLDSSSENFVRIGTWDASPFTFEEV